MRWNSLEEILRFAIRKEADAAAFYRMAADRSNPGVKKTFEELYSEDYEGISNRLKSTEYGNMLKESMEYYNKTDSFAALEKNIDNYLMTYMKKAKFFNLGPEPLVVYMYARETEIRNLRIILVGKLNKVSESLIRERLRDSYV